MDSICSAIKRNRFFCFLLVIFKILVLSSCNYAKALTPKDIFIASTTCVVEIKAKTESIGESYGTGVIIQDGLIVTNYHVISFTKFGEGKVFNEIQMRFSYEKEYHELTIEKYNEELDLAFLSFKTNSVEKYSSIPLGDSSILHSGDEVYAIGNTANVGIGISKGLISIPSIKVTYDSATREVIQCDLNIAAGNSGGALLNSNGELVGITSFRLKDTHGNVIYGFVYCIPINIVLSSMSDNVIS